MLLSTLIFNNSFENYKIRIKEKYSNLNNSKTNTRYSSLFLLFAVFLLIIELYLLLFAIQIAVKTTDSNAIMLINILLALFFTIPYILINLLFNKNMKKVYE